MNELNPFHPPGPDATVLGRKYGLAVISAEVAVAGGRLGVFFNGWSGRETYSFDGTELLRKRSFQIIGRRRLTLPDGAQVEVCVHALPLYHISISVDGRRVVDDLFPIFGRLELAVIGLCALLGVLTAIAP